MVAPYKIHHIQLENNFNDSTLSLTKGGRYYFVFWWYSIALGDLYIEEYNESANELRQVILQSIEPCINFYLSKKNYNGSYRQVFIAGDYSLFSKLMNAVLHDYLQENLPDKVDISVVICTRNRSDQLEVCIKSLIKQICVPREIIIIDNDPLDDSSQKVAERYSMVTYYCEKRKGLDIARNTGAGKARMPIIAYADDDVQLHPLWAYRVWQSFSENNVDAMTGLIIASSLDTESQQIFEQHWKFNKGYLDKQFDKDFVEGAKASRVWDIGAGANMAFRKSILEKVNYFDERLDAGAAGCNGDSEIWFRILSAGHTICYNPRAIVHHEHRKELDDLHKQLFSYMRGHAVAALIQHGQNNTAGYKKHLYYDTPKYYLLLIRMGFPFYKFRYRTLWSEIRGLISGIRFYHKNKHISPFT